MFSPLFSSKPLSNSGPDPLRLAGASVVAGFAEKFVQFRRQAKGEAMRVPAGVHLVAPVSFSVSMSLKPPCSIQMMVRIKKSSHQNNPLRRQLINEDESATRHCHCCQGCHKLEI